MSRPWMPLYISDYLGDTRRLSTLQHGAYLLLIMEYWQHGGLPSDDAELADIAGLELGEWLEMRPRIARLFLDGWRHKRIDAELAKASEISDRRRASAERRWSKGNANALQEEVTCNARAGVPQPQPQLQDNPLDGRMASPQFTVEPKPEETAPRKASRAKARSQISPDQKPTEADAKQAIETGLSGEQFLAEWRKFRDYHLSRGSLMADWSAAWRTWLGNVAQFQRLPRAGPAGGSTRGGGVAQLAIETMNRMAESEPPRAAQIGNPEAPGLLPFNSGLERRPERADDGGVSRPDVGILIRGAVRRM